MEKDDQDILLIHWRVGIGRVFALASMSHIQDTVVAALEIFIGDRVSQL